MRMVSREDTEKDQNYFLGNDGMMIGGRQSPKEREDPERK